MPEIDADLFQVLALALLFLTLLALLGALSVLSGIKKQLDSSTRSSAPSAADPYQAPADSYQAPATSAYQPAPYEPTSSYTTPQTQATQEVTTGFVSMTDAAPAATASQTTTTAGPGLRGDEPEEQPFERDGRWWFKRGGELLVYDEGTGQWVASSSTSAPASVGAAPVTSTSTVAHTDAGEGWKCSSCGAVNGSTATSCRMCFAPR